MKRSASAVWEGDLKGGKGRVSTDSGVLREAQYSFSTRFENGVGTNPEELIAAAHAGCFAMAFSAQLGGAGLKADRIDAKATVTYSRCNASGKAGTASVVLSSGTSASKRVPAGMCVLSVRATK